MPARRHVFNSVFPNIGIGTLPTPQATPLLGSGPFGGTTSFDDTEDAATGTIRWERSWHNVTSALTLPDTDISNAGSGPIEESVRSIWRGSRIPPSNDLVYLLRTERVAGKLRESIVEWYSQETIRHFLNFVLPPLLSKLKTGDAISTTLESLYKAQSVYFFPFVHFIAPQMSIAEARLSTSSFTGKYHAVVAASLSGCSIHQDLSRQIEEAALTVLGLHEDDQALDSDSMHLDNDPSIMARSRVLGLVAQAREVGLGGSSAQRMLAEMADRLLCLYVDSKYAGIWSSPSTVPTDISSWIADTFAPFVYDMLLTLSNVVEHTAEKLQEIITTAMNTWQQRAICELGELRIRELFDIVVEWENNSKGAIEDLKLYVTTPATRSRLISKFSAVISQRLLQPAASTTQILQVYICIIRVFAVLDPRGVLLDRIARQIRRYLRDRDDSVKIIVGGLLAEPGENASSQDALVELANELNRVTMAEMSAEDDGVDDWDDLDWMPDPVDAGPEYRKGGATDVIGTLISLFETKDVFVREFQSILAARLLLPSHTYNKEVRVLELLKLRFGDAPLQACEVMLKDILDSRRTDAWVKNAQNITTDGAFGNKVVFSTKILSRLFWPSLSTEEFELPSTIHSIAESYSQGFEQYKSSRKLTWLPAVGQAKVELQLEDRVIKEEVLTWQAAVIYAFNDEQNQTAGPITKTADQLAEELHMDEDLLRSALTFWVGKRVLHMSAPDTYRVLETLPIETAAGGAGPSAGPAQSTLAAAASAGAAVTASSSTSAVRSDVQVMEEKMAVFWKFIEGMLTNQGAMPLGQITMMLKFAIPGGFPHSDGELKEFLGHKIDQGGLDIAGGRYKLKK